MRTLVLIGSALLSIACSRPNPAYDAGDDTKGGSASDSGVPTTATMGEGDTDPATDTALPTDIGDEFSCVPDTIGRRLDIRIYEAEGDLCVQDMFMHSLLELTPTGEFEEYTARACPSGCNQLCPGAGQPASMEVRISLPPELATMFSEAECVDVVASIDGDDDCRVDYFAAWLDPPSSERGPVDYVGVNEDADLDLPPPGLIPPYEFVNINLCGSDCLAKGDAVGEWALQFPNRGFLSHDTEGDRMLISDGGPVEYHVWNLQSYVSEDCQPHQAWFAQRLFP